MDTPAWWHLKRKRTMYYDGRTDARSVRTNMQFMLGEKSLEELQGPGADLPRHPGLPLSLEPPKYPFPIDAAKAARGKVVFEETCARCHGTYGPDGKYPNKIVPLDVIGTDPARSLGLSDRLVAHYNSTWLGAEYPVNTERVGYQAPPLDGIWATAPYLHNGSVPTLHALLQSSTRPAAVHPASVDRLRALRHRSTSAGSSPRSPPRSSPRPRGARRFRPSSSSTPRGSAWATAAIPSATSSPRRSGWT